MDLLTKEQTAQLIANGEASLAAMGEGKESLNHPPVVKLFDPAGAATWLLSVSNPEWPNTAFGLCDLGMGEPEMGSVSLHELKSIKGRFGLGIERDLHFTATYPMSVYARAAQKAGRIVTDRASLDAAASEGGAQ